MCFSALKLPVELDDLGVLMGFHCFHNGSVAMFTHIYHHLPTISQVWESSWPSSISLESPGTNLMIWYA